MDYDKIFGKVFKFSLQLLKRQKPFLQQTKRMRRNYDAMKTATGMQLFIFNKFLNQNSKNDEYYYSKRKSRAVS